MYVPLIVSDYIILFSGSTHLSSPVVYVALPVSIISVAERISINLSHGIPYNYVWPVI